ncbi:hypothetical protein ACHAPU_010197 [Fusarium lateritium]
MDSLSAQPRGPPLPALLPSHYLLCSERVQMYLYRIYLRCGEWPSEFLDSYDPTFDETLAEKLAQAVDTALDCHLHMASMVDLLINNPWIDSDGVIDCMACDSGIEMMKEIREYEIQESHHLSKAEEHDSEPRDMNDEDSGNIMQEARHPTDHGSSPQSTPEELYQDERSRSEETNTLPNLNASSTSAQLKAATREYELLDAEFSKTQHVTSMLKKAQQQQGHRLPGSLNGVIGVAIDNEATDFAKVCDARAMV